MTTLEIILLIIAIAFVVMVAFLSIFIAQATRTMTRVNDLLDDVNFSLHPLLSSMGNVSQKLESWTSGMNKVCKKECCMTTGDEEVSKKAVAGLMDMALIGFYLWKKLKKKHY